MKDGNALRRRIAPSAPLTLELADDNGDKFIRTFRLSFDFNAMVLVQELTGFSMLNGEIWNELNEKTLSAMFYAAALAQQPQYGEAGGLEVIRSYMDTTNTEPITNALNEAFLLQLPKERRERMEKAQKAAKEKGENPTPPATAPMSPDPPNPQI
jgi:hypothetical protein